MASRPRGLRPRALLPVHRGGGIRGAFPPWRPLVVINDNNMCLPSGVTGHRGTPMKETGGLPQPLRSLKRQNNLVESPSG